MATALQDVWYLAEVTVPQGTINAHQKEMVFRVIYGVTTIERYRTGIIPVLNKVIAKCRMVVANSPTDLTVAAENIASLYGDQYLHVTGIVKGPRENIATVQDVLIEIRKTLRGDDQKSVTLMFHPEMFDALLAIVGPTPVRWN